MRRRRRERTEPCAASSRACCEGERTERARPDDFEAAADEDRHRVAGRPDGQRFTARGVRHRSASPAGRRDGRRTRAGCPCPGGLTGTPPAGRHRHGSVAAASAAAGTRGRPQPARPTHDAAGDTAHPGCARTQRGYMAGRSARASTCPTAERSRSTLVRSTGSSTAPTPQLEAVSGVCTHQGCKLWLDAPESRLRCPCHSTSFSLEGTHRHASAADRASAAAEVRGTRNQRCDRGFRTDELGVARTTVSV